jgi:hypothetical protein
MMAPRPRPVRTTRRGSRPLRLALALGAAVALAIPSSVVAAAPPIVVHDAIDFTIPRQLLTAACGYPVFARFVGTVNVVVQYDADGNPDSEVDAGQVTETIFAPSTGRSVSFPLILNAVADYAPDGSAIVQFSGVFIDIHSAGGAPHRIDVGREVWSAHIVDIRPDGVPVWELDELLSKSGTTQGNFADTCLALDP